MYTHPLSGIQFPEQVGPFKRKRIRRYDETGHKLGVRYALARTGQDVVASIRIYPGPGAGEDLQNYMQRHFDAIKAHIVHRHPEASLSFSGEIRLKRKGEILQGKKASFQFEDIFSYKVEQLLSHAYLFARGKWFMEFRVTYPQAQHDATDKAVINFISSFLWKRENLTEQQTEKK
jgi:hypothetical protein